MDFRWNTYELFLLQKTGSSGNQSWVEFLVLVFITICNAHDISNYVFCSTGLVSCKNDCICCQKDDLLWFCFVERCWSYNFVATFFSFFFRNFTVLYVLESVGALVIITWELSLESFILFFGDNLALGWCIRNVQPMYN